MRLIRPRLHRVAPPGTMRIMQIAGVRVELSAPYRAGHTCSAVEASILNDTWLAQITARFTPLVTHYAQSGKLTPDKIAMLQQYLDKLASTHRLGTRPPPLATEIIRREAIRLAKLDIAALWRRKSGQPAPDSLDARAEALVQSNPTDLTKAQEKFLQLTNLALSDVSR